MEIKRHNTRPYVEIITLCLIIIFSTLISWGTDTFKLLSLSSTTTYFNWWEIITYTLTCQNILSLISQIFLLSVLYRISRVDKWKRNITIPLVTFSIIGGITFYCIALLWSFDTPHTESLSSTILPCLSYMCFLSARNKKAHITFFTPRNSAWSISIGIAALVIIIKLAAGMYVCGVSYAICCIAGGVSGHIYYKIHNHSTSDRKIESSDKSLIDLLPKNNEERRLDSILEKISRVGYSKLSRSEKEFLRSISTKDK